MEKILALGPKVLKFLFDTVTDPTILHAGLVVLVGYILLHAFSKSFRAKVTADTELFSAKLQGLELEVESPFKRVYHAFASAIAGAKAGWASVVAVKTVTVSAPHLSVPSVAKASEPVVPEDHRGEIK
jgi:hypothetical protein